MKTFHFKGFGWTLKEISIGGSMLTMPPVPREWSWSLRLDWIQPWVNLPGEDMMGLPKRWHMSRWFYFGGWTSERKTLCQTLLSWLRRI